MSLENIIQEIDNRKVVEVNKIVDEYTKKLNLLQAQKEKKISEIIEQYLKKKSEEALLIEKRELDAAEFEAKKILMDRVSELINLNIEKAIAILENLRNTAEYREIINKMVQTSKKLLGNGCAIKISATDSALISDSTVKIVKEDVDKYGGLIAESEDKELDLTVSSIIRNLRDNIALELSNKVGEH